MDEIDAQGRQLLTDRPKLTKGRLSVYREPEGNDLWFPRLNVSIKKSGSDVYLWSWSTHDDPICQDEPPPYGEEVVLEKYFELNPSVNSPRGIEVIFNLDKGLYNSSKIGQFSASLYLFANSFNDRGVQIGVVDFTKGLSASMMPVFFRVDFPW